MTARFTRPAQALAFGTVMLLMAGCPPEPPAPTRIELVNDTARDLTPRFYSADRDLPPGELFLAGNEVASFVDRPFQELPAGGSATLLYDCTSDWTLGVRRPRAFEPSTLTVYDSADELVLHQGVDFSCGQVVRVIYFFDSGRLRVRVEVE